MNVCLPYPFCLRLSFIWELAEAEVCRFSHPHIIVNSNRRNETNMVCESTDYQVSADQSATVLRVWPHHWGCQVDCQTSNGIHSLQLNQKK